MAGHTSVVRPGTCWAGGEEGNGSFHVVLRVYVFLSVRAGGGRVRGAGMLKEASALGCTRLLCFVMLACVHVLLCSFEGAGAGGGQLHAAHEPALCALCTCPVVAFSVCRSVRVQTRGRFPGFAAGKSPIADSMAMPHSVPSPTMCGARPVHMRCVVYAAPPALAHAALQVCRHAMLCATAAHPTYALLAPADTLARSPATHNTLRLAWPACGAGRA